MKTITVFIALICMSLTAISQSDKFYEKEGVVYFNDTPYSGEFAVEEEGFKESVFTYESGLKNGKVAHYYSIGTIKEIGYYNKGEKDGKWEKWDEQGHKIAEAHYVNGKKTGSWLVWDNNGTKRYEMFYQEGEKAGTWKIWDDKGVLSQQREF